RRALPARPARRSSDLTGSAGAVAGPRHRGRWFASWVLIVVGSLLVPVSVTSLWLNRTITDTDRYVETVAPLIRDQDIQRAIEARSEEHTSELQSREKL